MFKFINKLLRGRKSLPLDFLHIGRDDDPVKVVYTDGEYQFVHVNVNSVTLTFPVHEFGPVVDTLVSARKKLESRLHGVGSETSTSGD